LISAGPFESTTTPGKYVSLSFWRDQAAVAAWRDQAEHGLAQARGKSEIFADFRIRVASVLRDYSLADRR
ncbi:MAG: antibiotic biosynthesis monooxygenase, partial [Gemmatimonadetes bacterium]|nr:antibiotic biosynthesis monooxygenase [Gemmatimonadota bacterium]